MNTINTAINTGELRSKLSTLWIFVVINIAFADIVGFLNPGTLEAMMTGSVGFEITPGLLLLFALLLEIPIAMIFLSRVLQDGANRWANISASIITILFVMAAGSLTLSYIFFVAMETVGLALIVWYAWKLPRARMLQQRLSAPTQPPQ